MLTSRDMCRLSGISYRQLDYWLRLGVLRCVGDNEPGSGSKRRYDRAEAFHARVIGDLAALGMPLASAALCVEQLREKPDRRGRVFVDAGGGISPEPWSMSCYVLDLDDLHWRIEDAFASR